MAENKHGGGTGALLMPKRPTRTKRRSAYVIGLVALAGLTLGIWLIARFTICWGGGGGIGAMLTCNGHLATLVMLFAALVFLFLLHYELSELHIAEFEGRRARRFWALVEGNRNLRGIERVLVATATLLGIGVFLAFVIFLFLTSMSL